MYNSNGSNPSIEGRPETIQREESGENQQNQQRVKQTQLYRRGQGGEENISFQESEL